MNSMFKHQDDMLEAEENQMKSTQHLSKGEYEDDSDSVSTFILSNGEYLDAASEEGDHPDKFGRLVTTLLFNNSFLNKIMELENCQEEVLKVEERKSNSRDSDGQHNPESDAEESEGEHTDWSYNLSEGELLITAYSDAESDGGLSEGGVLIVGPFDTYKRECEEEDVEDCYNNISEGEVCHDEMLNNEVLSYVFEDNISDGEVPNTINKGYLSDGELRGPCENELKYFLNIEDGRRCGGNKCGEGKTIKDIDNCLVNNMFDTITKVNRWLFPEGSDMGQEQGACCESNNSSRNVSNAFPDNSARNSSGDEANNLTHLTEVSIASSSIVKKRNKRNLFIRFCNFVSKRFKRN